MIRRVVEMVKSGVGLLIGLILSGCSAIGFDISKKSDGESVLDEAADQLLIEAETPQERATRMRAIVTITTEIAMNRTTVDMRVAVYATLKDLTTKAWAEDNSSGWTETQLHYTKKALLAIAVDIADENIKQNILSPGLSIDAVLDAIDTVGLVKAMRGDIVRAFDEKSTEELSEWLLERANRNLEKLEK